MAVHFPIRRFLRCQNLGWFNKMYDRVFRNSKKFMQKRKAVTVAGEQPMHVASVENRRFWKAKCNFPASQQYTQNPEHNQSVRLSEKSTNSRSRTSTTQPSKRRRAALPSALNIHRACAEHGAECLQRVVTRSPPRRWPVVANASMLNDHRGWFFIESSEARWRNGLENRFVTDGWKQHRVISDRCSI